MAEAGSAIAFQIQQFERCDFLSSLQQFPTN